jgi:hypothetical protein
MRSAIGQSIEDVAAECECRFHHGKLIEINGDCSQHGIAAVKAYHLKMVGEEIDDETAEEIMLRDTPEEYD